MSIWDLLGMLSTVAAYAIGLLCFWCFICICHYGFKEWFTK